MKTAEPKITAPWLQAPEVQAVVSALGADACRFVGGAVRDTIIGKPVSDIDMATTIAPADVVERLEAAGLKAVPTGIEHGTITAVSDHRAIEITTLRHDVESDGRHANVAFHSDWQADAARRDFTINAMYVDAGGTLFDYFGGRDDLLAGRVRFIGDADARIEEDALRILRFFRFHAWYGQGVPDPAGLTACKLAAENINTLSIERVRDELLKLLAAIDPLPVLKDMAGAGILDQILPLEGDLPGLARLVGIEDALDQTDPLRRLSALLASYPHAANLVAAHFRLSNAQSQRLEALVVKAPDIGAGTTPAEVRKATYWLGLEAVRDRVILSGEAGDAGAIKVVIQEAEAFEGAPMPVTGDDLKAQGVEAGPEMGALLRRLEDLWVTSDFTLGRDALLEMAGG